MQKPRHIYHDSDNVIIPNFHASQRDFIQAREPFLCISSGFGSGKTTALVWRALILLIDSPYFGDLSGNVGIIGRYHYADFEKTTLREIWKWTPKPWIRKYWKKDGILEFTNESILMFYHFDDKQHIVSLNAGFAAIDQMEQIEWDVFEELAFHRIRMKELTRYNVKVSEDGSKIKIPVYPPVPLNHQSVFGACNPRRGWIYDKFFKNDLYRTSNAQAFRDLYNREFRLITSSVYENIANLPDRFIDRQKENYTTRDFARNVLGSWDKFEGQVHDDFTDDLILQEDKIPRPEWDIYICIDHGGSGTVDANQTINTTGVVFFALEPRPQQYPIVHVFDELWLPSSTIEETVNEINRKITGLRTAQKLYYEHTEKFGELKSRCDPIMKRKKDDSTESLMDEYMRHAMAIGLPLYLSVGNNDLNDGIQKVNWLFRKKLTTVNPKCVKFIETHKALQYGLNEKPAEHQPDHLTCAYRYGVTTIPLWFSDLHIEDTSVNRRFVPDRLCYQTTEEQVDPIYGERYIAI